MAAILSLVKNSLWWKKSKGWDVALPWCSIQHFFHRSSCRILRTFPHSSRRMS
jgi:hypothetical protein